MTLARRTILIIDLAALCASLIYLTLEVAFHAQLVDLLGIYPSQTQIHDAEHVGRLLTGLAFTLFLLPIVLKRLVPLLHESRVVFAASTAAATVLVASLSVAGAKVGIEAFVERLTTSRTAVERRQAVLSLFIVSHLHKQQDGQPALALNGRDAPTYLRETVAGRLVLATLPFLLSNVGDLERRTREQVRAILADDLGDKLGSPTKLYNEVYVKGMGSLASAFQAYHDTTAAFNTQMLRVERDAFSDWENYTDELARNRLAPATASRSPAVRQKVSEVLRRRDPSLPPNWVPTSAEDFRVQRAARVQKAYEDALGRIGFRDPSRPPRIETFQQFISHADIRSRWCVSLQGLEAQLRDNVCSFGPREGSSDELFPAFEKAVFAPIVERKLDELVSRYNSPAAAYAEGGRLARDGYDAAKTAVVIPVALFFSLAGGLLHGVKCTWLLGVLSLSSWLARFAVPVTVASGLAFVTMVRPVPLADDPFTAAMRRAMHEKYGEVVLGLADSAMKWEPVVYPVGKSIPLSFFDESPAVR